MNYIIIIYTTQRGALQQERESANMQVLRIQNLFSPWLLESYGVYIIEFIIEIVYCECRIIFLLISERRIELLKEQRIRDIDTWIFIGELRVHYCISSFYIPPLTLYRTNNDFKKRVFASKIETNTKVLSAGNLSLLFKPLWVKNVFY